ncbi:unnamed protein product [Blepharisma stoltei]|uniref:Uncharacterized protein n=1 Tax=Blepharisma stoltei TaxID=1481888 RepID=A0AAU9IFJ1_9CILI|nr:unnamed protein product [Blepharisma stoltei]
MGCQSSREDLSKEERAIMLMEDQLEFFKNTCKIVDLNFRKYSSNGSINANQWSDITKSLGIKTRNCYQCPKVEEFYERHRTSNGDYRIKPLLTLGILMSSGTSRQKSKLLFEMLDPTNSKELRKEVIEEMLGYILDVCINDLPALVSNQTYPPVSEFKVRSYVQMLVDCREAAKEKLLHIFLNGNPKEKEAVTLHEFQEVFHDETNARLFFPHGVRHFVLKNGHDVHKLEHKLRKMQEDNFGTIEDKKENVENLGTAEDRKETENK